MKQITGLIGRDELVETVARAARKGHHLLLTGPVGVGNGAHQAKGQFLELARGLLESGLLKPSALELDAGLDALDPARIEWTRIKRAVNRLSIRDLCAAIVPALHAHQGRVLIAVDDLTAVTPTLVAFWLAVCDA
ncbi:MAG: ATP-binding protein, partial [Candidatus Contendobacter sp.]|nr:ATP-binding protein [Candidatus Contendobacter sp.]